jgi:hypothetical protein
MNSKTSIKKFCVFPDYTEFQLKAVLDKQDTQSCICYYHEDTIQTLWVPNDFIVENSLTNCS